MSLRNGGQEWGKHVETRRQLRRLRHVKFGGSELRHPVKGPFACKERQIKRG